MIARMFERLAARRETALIAYLTAGFPSIAGSMEHLTTIADAGADMIELGIPFCDPVADGPTIQRASWQALERGADLRRILTALGETRVSVPISLMSYLNPLLAFGRDELLDELARIGVSGLIVPDLPLEEAGEWVDRSRARGISLTLLVAPTSTDERVGRIAEASEGFLYYVSVTGTTGTRTALPADLPAQLARVRAISAKPVAVGFGISTPEQIRAVCGHAEGVVVGSRIVQAIRGEEDLSELIRQLKRATRSEHHAGRDEVRGEPC